MKLRLLIILAVTLTVVGTAVVYNAASPLDGVTPPHAVDTAGKAIPESSATQPDTPFILSKDSNDPKWGEMKPEMTFDHSKHNTDPKHTIDGKTSTACVSCHHTEQPMPVASQPYLKKSERSEVLTADQLDKSKQPVNSCRKCHFQEATDETAEFPPKGVTYPKEVAKPPSGKLTNDNAYHTKCIDCHNAAMQKDPTLKAPQACSDCHVKKGA